MTKSEIFVVAFKSVESVKYAGLDNRDSLIKADNPASLRKGFSHEQATKLVVALRKKGLEEGVTIRVKSLGQSMRDYAWSLIQKVNETDKVDEETMEKVLKRYEVKEAAKPVETETKKAEVAESAEAETTEETTE